MRVLSEKDLKLAPTSIELLKQLPHHPVFKYFALWYVVYFHLKLVFTSYSAWKLLDPPRSKIASVRGWLMLPNSLTFRSILMLVATFVFANQQPLDARMPLVWLQAHMDVVTSKNRDVVHDFETDPVDAFVEGDVRSRTLPPNPSDLVQFLKARGTTLGADNGIGVAAALAVLEDPSAVHGPLETLFTADEEDDFFGVDNLGPAPFLQAKILLNLDSEQECV